MIERRFLMAHRRRRFVVAAAEIAHEFGRAGITTTTICQIAHTARNTFYDTFESVDDCLRCGAAEAYEELFAPVLAADPDGGWALDVERAVGGFYAAVAAEPLLAELLLIHSLALADGGEAVYERGVAAVERLLAPGRPLAEARGHRPSPLTEELGARAIVSLAARKVRRGASDSLTAEAPEVARLVTAAFFVSAGAPASGAGPTIPVG